MGKRKHKNSDKDIRRKIRRLERKLCDSNSDNRRDRYYKSRSRHEDRYRRSETSNSTENLSDLVSNEDDRSDREYYSDREERSDYGRNMEKQSISSERMRSVVSDTRAQTPTSPGFPQDPVPSTSHQEPPVATAIAVNASNNEVPPSNMAALPDVPQEILNILGEAKKVDQALGEKIPSEISKRWGEILVDGLAKEQKESLTEKMLIPENFLLARAPKLNQEVIGVLSDTVKNRDKRLEKAQNQLGTGIAGLVNLTRDLIKEDIDKLEIIKRISEVSQILLDLHYEETVNRRKLIIPCLDKKFWNTIHGVKREEYLFGDKLGENIKNTKDIEKSSQQIKKPVVSQPPFQRKNVPGNSRVPPRQQSGAKSAAIAASRYQPSTSTRRITTQRSGRQTSSNKLHDKRRR